VRGSGGKGGGLTLAVLSACAFGGSGVAAKPLIDLGLDPLQVVWMRVAGAAAVLLPVALRAYPLPRRRPGLVAGFGLLAVTGCQTLYFVAIARIPVGVAILVEFLGPALLLGWIRFVQRRPVTRAAAAGVLLATAGMTCVVEVWSGLAFDALGLLYAFGAACCQVAYFVLADHGADEGEAPEPVAVIAHGLLIGAAVLTAVAHPWTMRWGVLAHQASLGDREVPAVLLVGWIALVSTVVAYLTGVLAVRRLSPQVAAVVAALEAVVATVLAWILLAEHLGPAQLTGGALVMAGALVAQTAAPRAAAGEPLPPAPEAEPAA
jgi:drug/metabolite transporter (DMT)-like permease